MKVLHVTNMYPNKKKPWYGIFIYDQIKSLDKYVKNDVYFIDGVESKFNYFKAFKELKKYRGKYDIIHAHHGWCGIICRMIFKKEKIVVSLVGGDLLEKKILYKKIIASKLRKDLKKFEHIIVKSSQMLKEINRFSNNISNVPNGVDLDTFKELNKNDCKNKLNLDIDKKYFLFTAAANDRNRIEKRYDIVKGAEQILKDRGINNFEILFLANVKHEDVPIYINSCEAILLSSDYEGSPNIVKEALSCNIPVVSTDVGNVKEMINDIKNCLIVNQSSQVFANEMEKIIKRENNRCLGRDKIKSMKLDTESVAKRIYRIYTSEV